MTIAPTLTVYYSCPACGITDRAVPVPVRGEEEILVWMETLTAALANDHREHSPFCRPSHLHNIKIPMTGAEKVGGPAIN